METYFALGALLISALLVPGALYLREAWREARWNAGRRLR